mmetsp:Transcript_5378/g.17359  ORF Transcript_5378/g.17359 Transcript_5378/m.17359 type:complete len:243 (+) Transcript_5378:648-1376(+)
MLLLQRLQHRVVVHRVHGNELARLLNLRVSPDPLRLDPHLGDRLLVLLLQVRQHRLVVLLQDAAELCVRHRLLLPNLRVLRGQCLLCLRRGSRLLRPELPRLRVSLLPQALALRRRLGRRSLRLLPLLQRLVPILRLEVCQPLTLRYLNLLHDQQLRVLQLLLLNQVLRLLLLHRLGLLQRVILPRQQVLEAQLVRGTALLVCQAGLLLHLFNAQHVRVRPLRQGKGLLPLQLALPLMVHKQ